MREIKFRAWDEKSKKIYNITHLSFMRNSDGTAEERGCEGYYGDNHRSKLCLDNIKLMQYIGLKDKNGKEIYEGDIVGKEGVYHFIDRKGWEPNQGDWKIIGEKSKNFTGEGDEKYIAGYELKVVDWQNTGFYPFADSPNNCGHCGGGSNSSDFEIIGNIYENPELLNPHTT